MTHLWIAAAAFSIAYLINVFVITVLYHRGLAHQSVLLSAFARGFARWLGPWLTGIDPKGWAAMHRLHHQHSDTELDPHSPHNWGIVGVAWGQLKSYERILRRLLAGDPKVTAVVRDIPFGVSILNRKKIWFLPYLLHIVLASLLGWAFSSPLVGVAYYLGIMSHPVQGWLVNSLAHRFGYRNFDTDDLSRNNRWVAYLVFGEGYQNNHHAFPRRACFGQRRSEIDLGYVMCVIASRFGWLELAAGTRS